MFEGDGLNVVWVCLCVVQICPEGQDRHTTELYRNTIRCVSLASKLLNRFEILTPQEVFIYLPYLTDELEEW